MHHGHSHDGGKCGHSHGGASTNIGFGDEENIRGGQPMVNPMNMMMPPQMTPQMMEFAKKMHEQRQLLMKEFMEQGGNSNPQAVQDLMTKAAQIQAQAMAQFKAASLAPANSLATSGPSDTNTAWVNLVFKL
jgi:hypothetical protein